MKGLTIVCILCALSLTAAAANYGAQGYVICKMTLGVNK